MQILSWLTDHKNSLIVSVTALAALITAVATYVQAKRLKISLQVETLQKLVERFHETDKYERKRTLGRCRASTILKIGILV